MQTMVPLYGFGGVPYSAVRKAAPRNLLDNSDFTNPVNQRGQSSYTSAGWGYCIDRWLVYSSTATITENGLQISDNGSSSGRYIIGQRFALNNLKKNPEDYTFVYCDSDDVIHFSPHKYKYNEFWEFWIECSETTVIKWAALYEGTYTAETLPEYQPKGYGAELAECQRYYQNHNTTYWLAVNSDGVHRLSIPIPKMRTIPSVYFESVIEKEGTAYLDSGLTDDCLRFYAIGVSGFCGVTSITATADL